MKQLGIPGIAGRLCGELIVDLFAGGGGASVGIEQALGRSPDIAINHNPIAIACHEANHPATTHYQSNVLEVSPIEATQGVPVGLLWASPDCTYHSRAKGGAPIREKGRQVRSLPWVVVRWAALVRPRVICLENVPEIEQWGPVRRGRPRKSQRGRYWRQFLEHLHKLGYAVEYRVLAGCDYGAPTSRRRLFLVARRDGLPIVWPEPSHGLGRQHRHPAAADCIDWSLPCPSIFLDRAQGRAMGCKRPLADATLRRIARGLVRYVLEDAAPFIVPLRGSGADHTASHSVGAPLSTISAGGTHHALIAPWLMKYYGGVVGIRADRPADTITAWDHHAVVCCHIESMYGASSGSSARAPLPTITAGVNHHAVVAAFLTKYYSSGGQHGRLDDPMPTIVGTDRHALVTVQIDGETYAVVDIGMRMLQPMEMAAAQGLPTGYRLPKTKKDSTAMIGNSVCPPVARALVAAQFGVAVEVAA